MLYLDLTNLTLDTENHPGQLSRIAPQIPTLKY